VSESGREGACNTHTQMEREHILYERTLYGQRERILYGEEHVMYRENAFYIERTHYI
jgi:hypothetical protein